MTTLCFMYAVGLIWNELLVLCTCCNVNHWTFDQGLALKQIASMCVGKEPPLCVILTAAVKVLRFLEFVFSNKFRS